MERAGNKAEEVLDAAEALARSGGYHGFSFRDVAARVGIKSASVHYHFPTKADLGAAVARRYTERFLAALGDPADPAAAPGELVARYVAAFRHALAVERRMCLCGMLGSEVAALPAEVAAEAKAFFERNIAWLEIVLARRARAPAGNPAARRQALSVLAALEGALIVARTLEDPSAFDRVAEIVTAAR